MTRSAEFCPAWASPPGDTIRELVLKKGLSLEALASALDVACADVTRLLDGALPISERNAESLAALLGASPRFWIARETRYREDLQALQAEERTWVANLPLADMAKFGWIGATSSVSAKVRSALEFFESSSVDEWRDAWLSERAGLTAYRTSPVFTAQAGVVAAWLRQGEIAAKQIRTAEWSRADFERLLPALKPLTRLREPSEFVVELQQKCSECGVAVVIVRAPKGCPASGATRTKGGRAILQLSVRYLSDDHFWFTFFHEAAHLILHEGRLFLEWSEARELDQQEEREANEFASQFLVPANHEAQLRALPLDYKSIMRFARNLSISPGIVVGQLQHRGLVPRNKLNYLKKRYSWSDD